MDDQSIIELFIRRDENAIKESKEKYGKYCARIASNILSVSEDVEECLNDTWISAWNRIPPLIPVSLKAFYGKLVRDIQPEEVYIPHRGDMHLDHKMVSDACMVVLRPRFDYSVKRY